MPNSLYSRAVYLSKCRIVSRETVLEHSTVKVKSALSIMAKLTRDQIAQGLDTIPMTQILIGAQGTTPTLTAKQIAFAKELALGKSTKAQAYRNAYQSKGNPKSVGTKASVLSTDDRIRVAVDAFKVAEQFKEYQTPSQLRALVVSQLTKHVLDEDFPPAQRVACLKLLGSVAEIGLFVDRKETLVVHQSSDIRAKLIEQLRTITGQVTDVTDDADSLLDEIKKSPDPTVPVPPVSDVCDAGELIHTIPLKISNPESIPLEQLSENSNSGELHESGELQPPPISDENVSR